jgi:general secretion pathway protein A
MYESYYNLREMPFTLTPDPAFLYYSPQHKFALAMLQYGLVSRAGFSVLTGEVGSGKSLLVRQLLMSLEGEVTVGLISNTSRQLGRLLQWVSLAYGIDHAGKDDATLYQAFVDFLVREYAAGRQVVLIVDEAQNLSIDMLEQLRVLSNVNADKNTVLQTILVGQPELLETLKQPNLRQFAQRIGVDYHLGALSRDDVHANVQHRLKVAGGSPDLISPAAIDLAHAASGGVPRLVNQLCHTALVHGFAEQVPQIDGTLMRQVIASRLAGGIFPGAGRSDALARIVAGEQR